ncbi:MAG: radical SAM protein [Nanoarchaeota archaeon]|nr:radical SAM protein [Nanoarchaeota archaeon]
MRIAFINSPLQNYDRTPKREYYTTPPIGLGYLATIAKEKGCDVKLIDAEALGLSPQKIVEHVEDFGADVVGINLTAPIFEISKNIIRRIKNKTHAITIAGGPDATIRPEFVLDKAHAIDMVVRGEGERVLEELIDNNFNPCEIEGVSFREKKKVIHNPSRKPIDDLNSLPFIDRRFFTNDPHQEGESLKSVIMGSRGCLYNCSFCSAPLTSGRKIRTRSVENIVNEMGMLNQKFGVDSVHFLDNDFIYNKERVLNLGKELQRRNLGMRWRALARVDITAKYGMEFLRTIKDAGCYQLVFGVESGSQRILDSINKGTTPEQAKQAIQYCKDVGIKTKAYYMFGFPTETTDEMNQTLEHAKQLDTDTACFILVKAYPGTEMYNSLVQKYGNRQLQKYNHLQSEVPLDIEGQNFDKYHIGNKISFCEATPAQLRGMLRKAYNLYYPDGGKRK